MNFLQIHNFWIIFAVRHHEKFHNYKKQVNFFILLHLKKKLPTPFKKSPECFSKIFFIFQMN